MLEKLEEQFQAIGLLMSQNYQQLILIDGLRNELMLIKNLKDNEQNKCNGNQTEEKLNSYNNCDNFSVVNSELEIYDGNHKETLFSSDESLSTNIGATPHDKEYLCIKCDQVFRTPTELKIHDWSHKSEGPYGCINCDMTFSQFHNLQRHNRIHTEERPYSCTNCDKSFITSINMKQHNMSHTGERPYSCTKCDKSFITSIHMKQHNMSHTGERSYSCTKCDKSSFTLLI